MYRSLLHVVTRGFQGLGMIAFCILKLHTGGGIPRVPKSSPE